MRLLSAGGLMMYLPDAWIWHRRQSDDLALAPLLSDMFLRGRIEGFLTKPLPLMARVRRGSRMLAHAASERCARGLLDFVREAGRAVGEFEHRHRRGRSTWMDL